jgi:hypothetical protein
VAGVVLLALLAGRVENACGQAGEITVTNPVAGAPGVVPYDYIYYPNYGVYYNPHQHLYHYLKGDAWVTGPAPEGISEKAFQTSPWVKMDFHDAPARHHAAILKKYPRDWKPAAVPVSPGPAPQNLKP